MLLRIICTFVVLVVLNGCQNKNVELIAQDSRLVVLDDFAFLVGSWDGSLEYLNYGDDKTRVTLPTRAVYQLEGDKISYQFVYTEPNGRKVDGQGSIAVDSNSGVQFNGGAHQVVGRMVDAENELYEIKLTQRGMDNNREAQIDHVIQRNGDKVSITRYILLDGAVDPFVRHTYTFNLDE